MLPGRRLVEPANTMTCKNPVRDISYRKGRPFFVVVPKGASAALHPSQSLTDGEENRRASCPSARAGSSRPRSAPVALDKGWRGRETARQGLDSPTTPPASRAGLGAAPPHPSAPAKPTGASPTAAGLTSPRQAPHTYTKLASRYYKEELLSNTGGVYNSTPNLE